MPSHHSCRVCLKITPFRKLKAIFEDAGITANNIYLTTGVQIMDMLNFTETAMICEQCKSSLDVAVNFRNLCRKSDLIFREITFEHEEKNWAKNLLTLQYNIPNEEMTVTEAGLKCEVIEDPVETIEKVDEDKNEYEYIAYEIDDLDYVDENNEEENIEYLEREIKDIQDLKVNQRKEKKTNSKTTVKLKENNGNHVCSTCGLKCRTSYYLEWHKKACKKVDVSLLKMIEIPKAVKRSELECRFCGIFAPSAFALKKHIDRHKEAGDELVKKKHLDLTCKLCGYVCPHEESMRMHIYFHRKKSLNHNIDCTHYPNCKTTFFSIKALQFHIAKYHKQENYLAHCDKCGESFTNKSTLSIHLACHLGREKRARQREIKLKAKADRRNLPCSYCGKILKTMSSLNSHEKRHKVPESQIFFHCDLCGRRFTQKHKISSHIKYDHIEKRRFYCDLCPEKSWGHKSTRDSHVKLTHLGVRESCHICGKEYYSKQALRWHVAVHFSEYEGTGRKQLAPEKTYQRIKEYKLSNFKNSFYLLEIKKCFQ